MIGKPALHHVDELVVAARIGRPQKESRLNKKTNRVFDDTLNYLAVTELHLDPDSRNDWLQSMEAKAVVIRFAIQVAHKKDGLHLVGWKFLDEIRFEMTDPKHIAGALRRNLHGLIG
jgi:hypothetical protein